MIIFAVDLAAKESGFAVLDATEEPYRVLGHGVVSIRGKWSELACWETRRAWGDLLQRLSRDQALREGMWPRGFDCIAYEVAGRSDIGDGHKGQATIAEARGIFKSLLPDYTRRIERLDQADVKEAMTRDRRANKQQVSTALEMRCLSGEFVFDGEFGSDHETDALAIALTMAARLKLEAMA